MTWWILLPAWLLLNALIVVLLMPVRVRVKKLRRLRNRT